MNNDDIRKKFRKYKKHFNRINELIDNIIYDNNELYERRQKEGLISFDVLRENDRMVGLKQTPMKLTQKQIESLIKIEEFMEVKLMCVRSTYGAENLFVGDGNSVIVKSDSVPPREFLDEENINYDEFETYILDEEWSYQTLLK